MGPPTCVARRAGRRGLCDPRGRQRDESAPLAVPTSTPKTVGRGTENALPAPGGLCRGEDAFWRSCSVSGGGSPPSSSGFIRRASSYADASSPVISGNLALATPSSQEGRAPEAAARADARPPQRRSSAPAARPPRAPPLAWTRADGVTRRCSHLAGEGRGRRWSAPQCSAKWTGVCTPHRSTCGESRAISGDLGRSRAIACSLVQSRAISCDLARSRGISSARLHHSIAACPRVGQSPRPASRGERSTSPCRPAYGEAAAM